MNIGHNTSFISENFCTTNAQLFLFSSMIIVPMFNLDLINLTTLGPNHLYVNLF